MVMVVVLGDPSVARARVRAMLLRSGGMERAAIAIAIAIAAATATAIGAKVAVERRRGVAESVELLQETGVRWSEIQSVEDWTGIRSLRGTGLRRHC